MTDIPPLGALAPDPESAEVVAALCDSVDRVGARIDARAIDRDHAIPAALLDELSALGLAGLSLPAEHGGFGFGLWETGAVIARLAMYDRSVATTLGLHLGLGSRGLVRWGTPAQQARWLPRMATGEVLAAFAATEPDAGSDLGALRTRLAEEGEGLRVDGAKIYVTNGGLAGLYTIATASPGMGGARRGQSVVVLERGDPGLEVGAEEDKLGLRGSSTTSLNLDAVSVPADRLLGQAGQGAQMLAHILAWGRTVMAAGCCGTGAAAIAAARRHCAVRVQFGRPLDHLAVVADQLELAAARLYTMEALVRHASWQPAELDTRSLAAKVYCSEGACELADLAVQLHGGAGFIEETGVALLLRDARVTRIFEGANDVLRIHMGLIEATLAPPRPPLAALGTVGEAADALAAAVSARVREARAALGARLGGAHVVLHRLGALVLLRAATDAAALRAAHEGTTEAESLAARWAERAHAESLSLLAYTIPVPARRRRDPAEVTA